MSTSIKHAQAERGEGAEPVWQHLWRLMNTAVALDWFHGKGIMFEPDPPIRLREALGERGAQKAEAVSRVFPNVVSVLVQRDCESIAYLYDVDVRHIDDAEVFVVVGRHGCSVAVGGGGTYEYPPTTISSILFFLANPEVERFASEVLSNAEVPGRLKSKLAIWREVRDAALGLGRDAEDVFRRTSEAKMVPYLDVTVELRRSGGSVELTVGVEAVEATDDGDIAEYFYVLVPTDSGKTVKLFCDLNGDAVNLLVNRVADRRQAKTLGRAMESFTDSVHKAVSVVAALTFFDSSYLSVEEEVEE